MVYTMAKEARENNERNSAEGREDRGMKGLSYRCGDAKTPLLYETIGEHFDRMAEAHRDREAPSSPTKGSVDLRRLPRAGGGPGYGAQP